MVSCRIMSGLAMGSPRTGELYGLRRARATALVNGSLTISILPPLTNGLPTCRPGCPRVFDSELTTSFRAACAPVGSIEVPCLRRPPRALASITTWIATTWIALGPVAPAIGQAFDPYLMRPQLDGDPRNPPRFSRTSVAELGDGRQSLRFWLPRGKGKTGIDPAPPRRPNDQPVRQPFKLVAHAAP